jgi:predicted ATPase
MLLGHLQHGICRFNLGEFVAARDLLEQCHGLNDPAHRSMYEAFSPEDPHVTLLGWLAVTLTYLGYLSQGRARTTEALSEARDLEHVYTLANSLSFAGWIAWAANSPHEAQRRAQELSGLCDEHGFPHWHGWGLWHHGWPLIALGRTQEGITLVRDGLSAIRATGAVTHTPLALLTLADGCTKLGQMTEGLRYLTEAAQIIEDTDERSAEAHLHRLRGDLLNASGDPTEAVQSYHRAVAVARRQGAKLWELRAATSLARFWRDEGKRTEARDLLAPVYGWFTEGFDTPVLQDAKALLDQLTIHSEN